MANNPKKVKDPTEVALSAIQEALNIADAPESGLNLERADQKDRGDRPALPRSEPITPSSSERLAAAFGDDIASEPMDLNRVEAAPATRRAANDDRETIGQLLQALQKGRPRRNTYTIATIFSGLWLVGIGALVFAFLPSLQPLLTQGGGILVIAGLAALLFAPILLFYFLASLSWRGQELSMIAQSMAQMAIRYSEPEGSARESMVTVGQAIRREVAAMGDGVERAIARAGELEALVSNEVAALERAYSDNEVRIRALLQDIAHQRDNLVGQAEQVRNAISGVQIDLRQDCLLYTSPSPRD